MQNVHRCHILVSLLVIGSAIDLCAQAPTFSWARTIGSTGNDVIKALDTDANGNIYALGDFSGTVDFDPGPGVFEMTAVNASSFVLKLDPNGDFLWARAFSASVNSFSANDISVDPAGHAWIIGTFAGTMDIDPGTPVVNITSDGGTDVFFVRLDPNGTRMRYGRGGGPNDDTGNSIVADDQGNAYMTGRVWQGAVFESAPHSTSDVVSGFNAPDVFVLKLPPTGDFEWYDNLGGFFWDEGNAITLDAQGNVLVAGTLSGPSDFGQGNPNILPGDGTKDIFVCKLSNSGVITWVRSVVPGQEDIAYDIATDALGDVYTTGTFYSIVDFDPGPGVNALDTQGPRLSFIQKLDAAGDFVWAGMLNSTNNNSSWGVHIDAEGEVWCTGTFQATTDFDLGPGTANLISNGGGQDGFLQHLDANGNYLWAGAVSGSGIDQGLAVTTSVSGALLLGGFFQDTADLDPGTGVSNATSAGTRDGFLVELDADINTEVHAVGSDAPLRLWPNPSQGTFHIDLHGITSTAPFQVSLVDALGKRVPAPTRALFTSGFVTVVLDEEVAPGVYAVQILAGTDQWVERLVVE
ncbi:MAG: T9SS type A sorting domain-containing protein [Flavobacteriales bacterium]|nr:T9SS type A sorting domain-containing protein [Flavobacteriales bacterium]